MARKEFLCNELLVKVQENENSVINEPCLAEKMNFMCWGNISPAGRAIFTQFLPIYGGENVLKQICLKECQINGGFR